MNPRKSIESIYTDYCDIYGFESVETNGITRNNQKTKLYTALECALSQTSIKTSNQSSTVNHINYDAKLFISPDIIINTGDEVEVNRHNRVYKFTSAGEPFVYESHQEVLLLRSTVA